jgi:hypothetical protein
MYWESIGIISICSLFCLLFADHLYSYMKPIPIFVLISLAFQNLRYEPLEQGIFIGLLFGVVGDILLLKEDNKTRFLGGKKSIRISDQILLEILLEIHVNTVVADNHRLLQC